MYTEAGGDVPLRIRTASEIDFSDGEAGDAEVFACGKRGDCVGVPPGLPRGICMLGAKSTFKEVLKKR